MTGAESLLRTLAANGIDTRLQEKDAASPTPVISRAILVYNRGRRSGLSDGNVHAHDQLPTVLAGRGGKYVSPGRHIIYQRETPVANLFASMIERVGVRPEHVGDSTGMLQGLSLS